MSEFRKLAESILCNNFLFESEQKVNWILSQPKLIQQLENRIKSDSKVPENITAEQLLKNFDNNSIVIGKFLPWVVKIYIQGNFEYTDLNLINNYLENFTKSTNKLEKKDINQYKSLNELQNALDSVKDIKGSREEKRSIKSGAEKIYEDNKWIILVPHTKEAAIQYGKGTKWCTAAINDNMFNSYNKEGPLYILINKQNPSEKYQFHFESDQFMDSEDYEIDLKTFLQENPEIRKYLGSIKNINKSDYRNWIWFDPKELTKQDYLTAVKKDWQVLKFVPEELKDYDMYLTAVKQMGRILEYVPENLKDYNICLTAVKQNGLTLEYVPEKFKDVNMCFMAMNHTDLTRKNRIADYIPKNLRYEVYLKQVKANYETFFVLPEEYKNYDMWFIAIKNNGVLLMDVPEQYKDYKMCLTAAKDTPWIITFVPKQFINHDFCLNVVKNNGLGLMELPEEFIDYEISLAAVQNDGDALYHVPHKFRDYKLCLAAVQNDPDLIIHPHSRLAIPEKYRDKIKEELKLS